MAKTFCEKHLCFCTAFTLLLICACGYLFYAGWWLPITINNHRLRHNKAVPFEIYGLQISDWYKYDIASQQMRILTYRQELKYQYEYMLGSFQPSNLSVDALNLSIDGNATHLTSNISGLIPVTWDSFTHFVDNTVVNSPHQTALYIAQYSSRICVDQENNTEINRCFAEWYDLNHNASDSDSGAPRYFIYTTLQNNIFVDVDSVDASDILDGPRDVFVFIIMMFCFIWFFLVIDFFEDPSIGWEAVNYLIISLLFIGAYYLWVFVLSVVPVLFSLPIGMQHIDYYRQSLYSLTFVVGDYDPLWWVAGVLLTGIWNYALVLFIPVVGMLYLALACLCCCDEERTDTWGACIIIPLCLLFVCVMIIFTIAYYVLFIGNMVFWNTATFNDFTDDNVIQAFTALLVLFVLLPLMACCLSAGTNYTKKYEKEAKRKRLHQAGDYSLQRLPIVKKRYSSNKAKKQPHTATETVPIAREAGGVTQEFVQKA